MYEEAARRKLKKALEGVENSVIQRYGKWKRFYTASRSGCTAF
jgi:hypothetical protein